MDISYNSLLHNLRHSGAFRCLHNRIAQELWGHRTPIVSWNNSEIPNIDWRAHWHGGEIKPANLSILVFPVVRYYNQTIYWSYILEARPFCSNLSPLTQIYQKKKIYILQIIKWKIKNIVKKNINVFPKDVDLMEGCGSSWSDHRAVHNRLK